MNIEALNAQLTDSAAGWLAAALLEIERAPESIANYFASASRKCGRAPWSDGDTDGLRHGCLDDLAREAMLSVLPTAEMDVVALVTELYRRGDANEKRGVLRGAHRLDATIVGDALLPLVDDALRSNDARLIAAAVQQYGAGQLGAAAYRHAVVKCVFVGIPLAAVVDLAARQDAELARMLVDLAHERVAAGRAVPADIPPIVAAFPESLDRPDLPADFVEQLSTLTDIEASNSRATPATPHATAVIQE